MHPHLPLRFATFALSATAVLGFLATFLATARAEEIARFPRADRPGTSWAVRVADTALAYTGAILPWDPSGAFNPDANAQAEQAVANLKTVLAGAGSDAAHVVRINVSVVRDDVSAAVDRALAAAFADNPPAVTFVRSPVGEPGALLALDAIAQVPEAGASVRRISVQSLPGAHSSVQVGILPAGEKIFISGAAEHGKDLDTGMAATIAALGRGLQSLGADKADVVQIKAVLRPFTGRGPLDKIVADFFAGSAPPPVVVVEGGSPKSVMNEIEITAAGGKAARPAGHATYGMLLGHPYNPRFSGYSVVAPGVPLIFIAGLEGKASASPRAQIEKIFSRLGEILFETGSSYSALVKSTGYYTNSPGQKALSEIRGVYYNPAALPAATIVEAAGAGRPGVACTLDMIAMPVGK